MRNCFLDAVRLTGISFFSEDGKRKEISIGPYIIAGPQSVHTVTIRFENDFEINMAGIYDNDKNGIYCCLEKG